MGRRDLRTSEQEWRAGARVPGSTWNRPKRQTRARWWVRLVRLMFGR